MKLPHNFYRGRAITMDCHHCITESAERKKGQHLRMEDRGAIKVLKKQLPHPRAIARQIGCAPSTVTNELRRGRHRTARATRGKLQVTPHAGRSRL
ncbi:MAG: helix-turn-helix domain-containing protein [Gallintestinimicrobium sp.]